MDPMNFGELIPVVAIVAAVAFALIALLTYSPFFLGGAIMCFGTGFKHSRLAKKAKLSSIAAVEAQT
jgi:hypothetical protein